jgi:hypothetical protein
MVAGKHIKGQVPQKYIDAHNDILTNFNTRFPESKLLQKLTHTDPEELVRQALETISQSQDRAAEVLRLYESKRVPVPLLAAATGKNEFDTWAGLINESRFHLYMAAGTNEEEQFNLEQCDKAAKHSLVLSLSGLMTFSLLGLLEVLASRFTCIVFQSTLDELHRIQQKAAVNVDGYMLIHKEGEQFIRTEVTAEDTARVGEALNKMVAFVEERCQLAGLQTAPSNADLEVSQKVGIHNLHTALLGKEIGMPVLSDDKPLAEVMRLMHGTAYINTQSVLQHLLRTRAISDDEYLRHIHTLLLCGYTYVRLRPQDFFATLVKDSFNLTAIVRAVLQMLEAPETTLDSAVQVGAWLLGSVFLDSIPIETKRNIGMYILQCVTQRHERRFVLVRIRALLRNRLERLAVVQLQEVNRLISDWERTIPLFG